MDFNDLCTFFDGSPFFEELRFDCSTAIHKLEIRKASFDDTPESRAADKLLEIILDISRGGHKQAQEKLHLLLHFIHDAKLPLRWKYRLNTYTLLNWTHTLYPPLVRSATVAHGPSTLLIEECYFHCQPDGFHTTSRDLIVQNERNRRYATALDVLEFDSVLMLHITSKSIHGLSPSTIGRLPTVDAPLEAPANPTIDLGSRKVCLQAVSRGAEERGLITVSCYLNRLLLEADRARRWSQFGQSVLSLYARYESLDDKLGKAICHLLIGDNIAAGHRTSPLWLNIELSERGYNEAAEILMSPEQEPLLRPDFLSRSLRASQTIDNDLHYLIDIEVQARPRLSGTVTYPLITPDRAHAALSHYDMAERIYREAEISSGVAQTLLRKSGILHMLLLQPHHFWSSTYTYHKKLHSLLKECSRLSAHSQDPLLHVLVMSHGSILEASSPNITSVVCISNLVEKDWRHVLARNLALLYHRMALHFRYNLGAYRQAMCCLRHAHAALVTPSVLHSLFFDVADSITDIQTSYVLLREGRIQIRTLRYALGVLESLYSRARSAAGSGGDRSHAHHQHLYSCSKRLVGRIFQMFTASPRPSGADLDMAEDIVSAMQNAQPRNPDIMAWINDTLASLRNLRRYGQLLQSGISGDPATSIQTCITLVPRSSASMFEIRYLLKILIAFGRPSEARTICEAKIQGDHSISGLLPHSPAWTEAIRRYEDCLIVCVESRMLSAAIRFLSGLESLHPGYLTSIHGPTRIWPWQRRLWSGLAKEHAGDWQAAVALYSEAMELSADYPFNMDFEQGRAMYNQSDLGRITTSIARNIIRTQLEDMLGDNQDSHTALTSEPHHQQDRMARMWRDFATVVVYIDSRKAQHIVQMLQLQDIKVPTSDGVAKYESGSLKAWLASYRTLNTRKELQSTGALDAMDGSEPASLLVDETSIPPVQPHGTIVMPFLQPRVPKPEWFFEAQKCLPRHALVIYTATSDDGTALVVFSKYGIFHASWLEDLTSASISLSVGEYLLLINNERGLADPGKLSAIAASLSAKIIKPVHQYVCSATQIIFVPSGDLARFPLGVLMLDTEPISLTKHVFQTPNLALYFKHRQRQDDSKLHDMCAIAKPGTVRESLSGEAQLPMGGIEAFIAAAMFKQKPLNAGKLSRDDFRTRLENSSWVHVCTHGYFNAENPQLSHLSFKQQLRVLDLTGVVSRAQVVILSACLSSEGLPFFGDDVIGFSHAILSTGVNVVAGCLWKVSDLATLLHMTIFYGAFQFVTMVPGNVFEFLHLWHWSLKQLRALKSDHAERLLREILAYWDYAEKGGQAPKKFVRDGRSRLEDAIETLTSASGESVTDFSHPYIWAPFQLVGYADFCLVVDITLEEQQKRYGVREPTSEEICASGRLHIDLDRLDIDHLFTALERFRSHEAFIVT